MGHILSKLSPLGWRLVSATVAFSTVIALLATAFQLYLDYRRDLSDIDATFEQVQQSYLPTISNALWATSLNEIQVAINGLVRLPNVQYVLVSENAKTWAFAGTPKTQDVRLRRYLLQHRHRGQTLTIGELTVVMDMHGVYQRLLDKFWIILVTNGVKTFLVAGFMLLLFHLLVTRHLRDIANYAAQFNMHQLDYALRLKRKKSPHARADEFDLMVSGLERMRLNLAESLSALRDSEERYRTVADFTYDWEYWLAPDGSLLYISPSCERLTGYAAEDFLREPDLLVKIMHEDDKAQFADRIYKDSVAAQASYFECDFRIRTQSGEEHWIGHAEQPVYDSEGQYRGRRASNRDITERKLAEAAIQSFNVRLEHLVSERTAQLEAVNRELEAFSYSVSHDLRTPLRSIDGFSQALVEDYGAHLDEVGHDYLHRVRKAAQRMGLLIDDLLQLARVTRTQMQWVVVDLSALTQEVIADFYKKQADGAPPIHVQAGVTARGDPLLLRLVMQNLLDNAWKYTGKTTHRQIEVGCLEQAGRTVYFVRDNGVGFDMAYVGKLFGAFQRLHRAEEFPGTGIGLATVKRIVHRHGGEVWAEGQPGMGATISFTLGHK